VHDTYVFFQDLFAWIATADLKGESAYRFAAQRVAVGKAEDFMHHVDNIDEAERHFSMATAE